MMEVMHLQPGDRIGDWIVDEMLGEGGMGAVYRAHSTLTGRLEAAIKVMKPALGPEFRARFVREAEALSSLRHPAIVRVMGFAEDPKRGLLYLVMELAYGETLKARMARGALPLAEALRVFSPLASALSHAHEEGISHRDLKPANVVLCQDGPRLVDFGIAAAPAGQTLTDGTGQLGTLAYLPPEVFRGLVAEPRQIDVYAFGLLLHEALTGERVFPVDPGMTPPAAAAAVGVRKLQQPPSDPGPEFPDRLRDIVRRATDSDVAKRPTMEEIQRTLASLVERRGRGAAKGIAPDPTDPVRIVTPEPERTMRVPDPPKRPIGDALTATPVRFRRKRPLPGWIPVAAAAGGLAMLLAVGVAVMTEAPSRPRRSPRPAASVEPAATPPPTFAVPPPTPFRPRMATPVPTPSPSPTASGSPQPSPERETGGMAPSAAATPSAATPAPAVGRGSPRPTPWATPEPPVIVRPILPEPEYEPEPPDFPDPEPTPTPPPPRLSS